MRTVAHGTGDRQGRPQAKWSLAPTDRVAQAQTIDCALYCARFHYVRENTGRGSGIGVMPEEGGVLQPTDRHLDRCVSTMKQTLKGKMEVLYMRRA